MLISFFRKRKHNSIFFFFFFCKMGRSIFGCLWASVLFPEILDSFLHSLYEDTSLAVLASVLKVESMAHGTPLSFFSPTVGPNLCFVRVIEAISGKMSLHIA